MKVSPTIILITSLFSHFLAGQKTDLPSLETPSLQVRPLSEKVYLHISYLNVPDYGAVPCNGLIYANGGEALIWDSPTTDSVSHALIDWVETHLGQVRAVIPTHFHIDCLGGLQAFHERNIPSYSSKKTRQLARQSGAFPLPKHAFKRQKKIRLGGEKAITRFPGEGHTSDNVVGYVPEEEVLFGGCLVKSLGAGEGNLADANLAAWPETIRTILRVFPHLKTVVPGHGPPGDTQLLNYTIRLFED